MFIVYIKTAWRSISRSKAFSALNIAGLVISVTAFLLMALYIENELSYDRFNVNANNIYRVADDKQTPDVLLRSATSAAPVSPALQQDFPEIKEAVRLINTESLIKYNDKAFEERHIFFSDVNLFKVFSFAMLKGNAGNALREPSSIVLTAAMSHKYFNNENPLGRTLLVDGKNMTVTGVMQDLPRNSHLQWDFLISMATAQQKGSGYDWLFTNWYSNEFYTYILLPQNYNVNHLSARLADFDKRHQEAGGTTTHHYQLEKLTSIYLHSGRDNQAGATGSATNLSVFSAIALFILLIACINFINLSTARSTERARDVAVKKIIGAERSEVMMQFFTESFLLVFISIILSLAATALLLPAFNEFAGKDLVLAPFSLPHVIVLLSLLIVVSLLSGSYPAFILSGFKPIVALHGKMNVSGWSIRIRKGLVVFQFAISVILIVCSLVVYHQMQYLQQHDLGFTTSQTLVINFEGDKNVRQKINTIKQQLLQVSGVQQITASSNVPGDGNAGGWSMDVAKRNGDTIHTELAIYLTDFNFLHQYKIPVVAGRALSGEYAADTVSSMLINETALRELGFRSADEALGVHVGMYPADGIITGVYKDFHFKSLQSKTEPLAIRVLPDKFRLLSVEINTSDVSQTVAGIESKWKQLAPERPLEYSFLDESFSRQYVTEVRYGQVITLFTVLAVFIACLGLFGLAMFSTQQRTKEIGIRKVLGASVASIVSLISQEFIGLVFIAIAVATPVSWLAMNQWLQHFAYRISIGVWIFILAGVTGILIALLTISFQAIKAAIANPVKSLRME